MRIDPGAEFGLVVNVEAQPVVCVNGTRGSFCGDSISSSVLRSTCQQIATTLNFPSSSVIGEIN